MTARYGQPVTRQDLSNQLDQLIGWVFVTFTEATA